MRAVGSADSKRRWKSTGASAGRRWIAARRIRSIARSTDECEVRPVSAMAAGESVRLVELGTHCRGAVFLDGRRYETPELAATVESLSRGFEPAREGLPGFCFGRYDVRFPGGDPEAHGADFQVLELNGMTAEATHIYDPSVSLLEAYRTLASQWRLAFEIAAANRRAGQRPATLREAFGELLRYRREQRLHRS